MKKQSELESIRRTALYLKVSGIGIIVIGVILIMINVFNGGFNSLLLFVPVIIIGFILIFVSSGYESRYTEAVKATFVLECLHKLFEQVQFDSTDGFQKNYIRDKELVKMGNIYHSNDLISASYKEIPFQMADILIQDESTDSEGHTQTTTLFKGQWFIFQFNKNFTGYLQLRDRENRLFRNGKPYNIFSSRENTKRIEFENDEFNNVFTSYASDDHEAFYLITPHFMEKLLHLKKQMDGELLIGFIDNQLHIAHNSNRDFFEPSLWKEIGEDYINDVKEDLRVITSIVDELDLSKS